MLDQMYKFKIHHDLIDKHVRTFQIILFEANIAIQVL